MQGAGNGLSRPTIQHTTKRDGRGPRLDEAVRTGPIRFRYSSVHITHAWISVQGHAHIKDSTVHATGDDIADGHNFRVLKATPRDCGYCSERNYSSKPVEGITNRLNVDIPGLCCIGGETSPPDGQTCAHSTSGTMRPSGPARRIRQAS